MSSFITLLSVVLLTGCGHENLIPQAGPAAVQIVDADLNARAMAVLSNRCGACHGANSPGMGNFRDIGDLGALVASNKVIPGDAAHSALFSRVAAGSMPPGGSLKSDELTLLSDWINRGLSSGRGGSGGEDVGGESDGLPAGVSTVTHQVVALLKSNCQSCHSPSVPDPSRGGIPDIASPVLLLARGLVVPGRSGHSPIYLAVKGKRMPAQGPALSSADAQLIKEWIDRWLPAEKGIWTALRVEPVNGTYRSLRVNVFGPVCLVCHGGANGTRAGVDFSTYAGTKAAARQALAEVSAGTMPEGYHPLDDDRISALKSWIDSGTPEN
jgi:mono/diheme cytochrome c family protein